MNVDTGGGMQVDTGGGMKVDTGGGMNVNTGWVGERVRRWRSTLMRPGDTNVEVVGGGVGRSTLMRPGDTNVEVLRRRRRTVDVDVSR